MGKICDFINIRNDFDPVIDLKLLKTDEVSKRILNNYVITPYLIKEVFTPILESFAKSGEAVYQLSYILQGVYGTGKSYALAVLNCLLNDNQNIDLFKNKILSSEKIEQEISERIVRSIDSIRLKKYITVSFDISQFARYDFSEIILNQLQSVLFDKMNFKLLNSRIESALSYIDSMHSEAKHVFESFLIKEFDINIDQLKLELIHLGSDGIEKFDLINKKYWGGGLSRLEVPVSTLLSEVAKELANSNYHLVFLIDEFSPYLLYCAEDKRNFMNILAQIQDFTEFCNNKNNNVSFVSVTHTHIKNLEYNLPGDYYSTLQKVIGRFTTIVIESFYFNDLLTNVLERNKSTVKSYIQDKISNTELRQLTSISRIVDIDFYETYPFHPYTIYILPFISTKFGQFERTNFKFISDYFKKISNNEIFIDSKLSSIKPSCIFDYFEETIKDSNDSSYIAFVEALNTVKEIYLGEDILKTLLVIYLSSTFRLGHGDTVEAIENGIPLERLAMILQVESRIVEYSLKQLLECNYIFFNDMNGMYSFMPSDSINPNKILKEINERQQILDQTVKDDEILKEMQSVLNLYEDIYITNPIERYFKQQICFIKDIKSKLHNKFDKNYLGKVLFLIPDRENFEQYLENINMTISDQQIVDNSIQNILVYSENISFKYSDFVKLFVIRKMLREDKYDTEYAKALLNRLLNQIIGSIKLNLSTLFLYPNYKIYWNKKNYNSKTDVVLYDVDRTINYLFPKTEVDFLKKGSAVKLIKNFISFGTYNGGSAEVVKLITKFMVPLGLATYSNGLNTFKATLSQPDVQNTNSYSIFRFIQDAVKSKEYSISMIFDELHGEPFGLNDDIISVYISVLIKLGKISILNSVTKLRTNEITDEVIKDLIKFKDNSFILLDYTDIDPIEYTTFSNELHNALTKDANPQMNIIPAKDAKDKLEQDFRLLNTKINSVIARLDNLEINTDVLNEIKSKVESFLNQEISIGDFLIKTKNLNEDISKLTLLRIHDFVDTLDRISLEVEKIILTKNILSAKRNNMVTFQQYQKLNGDFVILENSYIRFSENCLGAEHLFDLINSLVDFTKEYALIFNDEHKKYNQIKQEYKAKFLGLNDYHIYMTIITNDNQNNIFESFLNTLTCCENDIEPEFMTVFWPICSNINCKYSIGSYERFRSKLIIQYNTQVRILNTIINSYITSINKNTDTLINNKSKDIEKLNKYRNKNYYSESEKREYIKLASELIKNNVIKIEKNNVTKQIVLSKVDILKDIIDKRDINDVNDLIDIVFNWLNENVIS